jgi:hypothetical protein
MSTNFDYTLKYKYTTRGLDMIQAVYAFVMALGLREVFIGSSDFINAIFDNSRGTTNFAFVASLLFLFNVTLLGIRFFSVPRNLRGIVFVGAFNNTNQPGLSDLGSGYISLNWLIIFLQGGMYFFLCNEFKYIMFSLTSNTEPSASLFTGYFLGHGFLLVINGLWIDSLSRYEEHIRARRKIPSQRRYGSIFWSRNNLAFSLLALGPLSLLGTCQSAPFKCITHLGITTHGLENAIPTSSVMVSSLFDAITYVFSPAGVDYAHYLSLWVLGCYLLNSMLDLLKTGDHYILLEEPEWEARVAKSTDPGRSGTE